jgi:hypothetical protein
MPTLITRGAASIRGFGFAGASAPVNTVAPVVSGTATNGQTLSSTTGTWVGSPAPSYTYQWQRAGSNIGGATSSTYLLTNSDVGSTIRCVVTATNAVAAVSANSNSTAAVAAIVPGAPVIGTATTTGVTTATVSYTAPSSNGGATITSYTAVSSPGGITGSLSTSGSGTISVSGLTGSTSYTFTVYATNSAGNSASSSASNSITTNTPAVYMSISTSGACIYTCGNYKIARFTGAGSFTVTTGSGVGNAGNKINYLVVGGGGAGGPYNYPTGGGGGGGGVLNCCGNLCGSGGLTVTSRSYSVTVGGGGSPTWPCNSAHGNNSIIACLVCAKGGGSGKGYAYTGTYPGGLANGGSGGGGAGSSNNYTGGSGTSGQGNCGGGGGYSATKSNCAYFGGGGGGASGGGYTATITGGGPGGSGRYISFVAPFFFSTYGGGGGGGYQSYGLGFNGFGGSGGSGGAGSGGTRTFSPNATGYSTSGCNLTGGGGGGQTQYCAGGYRGYGGSGVVAIKWRFQ